MAAVHDNLHALFSDSEPDVARHLVDELIARNELELAAVTYLRGRSITGEFVIIDEAQNLELSTLKVILTRMSRDAKVVFCGDLSQVDNPYISPYGGSGGAHREVQGLPLVWSRHLGAHRARPARRDGGRVLGPTFTTDQHGYPSPPAHPDDQRMRICCPQSCVFEKMTATPRRVRRRSELEGL